MKLLWLLTIVAAFIGGAIVVLGVKAGLEGGTDIAIATGAALGLAVAGIPYLFTRSCEAFRHEPDSRHGETE